MKKIVIIGPECTGKSTLTNRLAAHYQTEWCPEYAREYLLRNDKNYSYNDLLAIAKGQVSLEDKNADKNKGNPYYFIDTDMYVMKVWCEFVFGKCHRFILDQVVERKYDLYLLCNVDLPWVEDELREYPDIETRQKLYNVYKDIMINQSVPWVEIMGTEDERFRRAVDAVEKQWSDAVVG